MNNSNGIPTNFSNSGNNNPYPYGRHQSMSTNSYSQQQFGQNMQTGIPNLNTNQNYPAYNNMQNQNPHQQSFGSNSLNKQGSIPNMTPQPQYQNPHMNSQNQYTSPQMNYQPMHRNSQPNYQPMHGNPQPNYQPMHGNPQSNYQPMHGMPNMNPQPMNNTLHVYQLAKQIILHYADNLFIKHDINRSGYLDVNQMYTCITELYTSQNQPVPNYQDVINLMIRFDDDRNGLIDKDEFRKLLLIISGK